MIRVFEPSITLKDIVSVIRSLLKKDISGSSQVVKKFENEMATKFDRKYGIAVSNGSVALDLSLQLLNLNENDEVILPSHTIISCLSAVIRSKAKPVFCDVDPLNWNTSVENVEKVVTKNTKALIMVHTYGLPVEATKIFQLCDARNILIIEDAAEAHGQLEGSKKCGQFGEITTFSFYANKHITTGEGGMLLTDSEDHYKNAMKMRNLDFSNSDRFKTKNLFWNYRMSGLQASLGLSQIKSLDKTIKKKIYQGNKYLELLNNYQDLFQLPLQKANGSENHYWVFGVVLKNKGIRDQVIEDLLNLDIETRPFFWPLHLQPSLPLKFKTEKVFELPVSEDIGFNGLYLPLGSHINEKKQENIVNNLISVVKNLI